MQITIPKRAAVIIVAGLITAVLLVAGSAAWADYTADGRELTTVKRMQVAQEKALDVQEKRLTADRLLAVKEAKAAQKRHDRKVIRRALRKQEKKHDKETAAAQAAGYSSGSAAGFSSGHATGKVEGEIEGYSEGFDSGYGWGSYDYGYDW